MKRSVFHPFQPASGDLESSNRMSVALFGKGGQKWDSEGLESKPQVILSAGFPKISSFRDEPMHPLTDGFVHSTSDSDHSPQPTGTRRLYQSNYRRSKTYWPGQLVMLAFY